MAVVALPKYLLVGLIADLEVCGYAERAAGVRELAQVAGIELDERDIEHVKRGLTGVAVLAPTVFSMN